MTKKTLKRIQAIRTELENIQTDLWAEGEREVSAAVQSAQRELETPGILIATQRADLDYGEPTSDPEDKPTPEETTNQPDTAENV